MEKRDRWLPISFVAKELSKSTRSIRRMLQQGHFVFMHVGATLRIKESSLDAYIFRQLNLEANRESWTSEADRDKEI
jgi:excisionase family DNA binding protein